MAVLESYVYLECKCDEVGGWRVWWLSKLIYYPTNNGVSFEEGTNPSSRKGVPLFVYPRNVCGRRAVRMFVGGWNCMSWLLHVKWEGQLFELWGEKH